MPATLFDKVWSSHVVAELSGGVSLLAIDRHLLHDLEAGPGFTRLADKGYSIRNPELTFATPDHSIATDPQRHTDSNKNGGRLLREMRRGAFAAARRGLRADRPHAEYRLVAGNRQAFAAR